MKTLLKSKSFDFSFLSQLLMHNSVGESSEWQDWEGWWTICKIHKGETLQLFHKQARKTETGCRRKRPTMCGDLNSNPCSISNQKTDLGRSLSSRDLNFFTFKVRIVLFALVIPCSTSHEEANTIPDGKAQWKNITPYIMATLIITVILEIKSGQDTDFSINV